MLTAAYGGRMAANPVYQAAVKRQQDKDRAARAGRIAANQDEGVRGRVNSIKAMQEAYKQQLERLVAEREERFHREFQYDITKLRMIAQEKVRTEQRVLGSVAMGARCKAMDIIRYHVANSDFTIDDVLGPRRYKPLTDLRHQVMADVYVLCPHLSLLQIAAVFGRDHTTILHAVKKLGVHYSQTGNPRQAGNFISLRGAA